MPSRIRGQKDRRKAIAKMTEQPDPHHIPAPDDTRERIADLVERYRRDADQYARGSYKQAQLRVEFVNVMSGRWP